MEGRITANLFLIGFLSALLATLLSVTAFHQGFENQIETDLKSSAELVAESYELFYDRDMLEGLEGENLRITLISTTGEVLFESDADIGNMDNHLNRPEVSDAIRFGVGQSKRHSETRMVDEYYYAIRLSDGNVIRTSIESQGIYETFFEVFPALVGVLFLMLILSVVLSIALTRNLLRPIQKLSENIDETAELGDEGNKIYDEFVPFVEKIRLQRDENLKQLKKLRMEEDRLETIIASMSDGLIILDKENRVLMINDSAKKFLGCESDPGKQNIVQITRNREIIECIEKGRREKSYLDLSLDGRRLQFMSGPVESSDKMIGVICFVLDVTEKLQAEKMRQEFTANVSHELKTPLTSISGYAEMIESGMASGNDATKFAGKIQREAGRMLTLISDIIRLSQLDEGNTDTLCEQVDLLEVARESAEQLSHSAEKHQVSISISGESRIVTGSASMLGELIYNLIDNGIRYNKPGGRVEVTVSENTLIVKDNGIGIPAKAQPRIFERFYRVDKSRSKESGGTGLGLAIVKHIATLYGWKISLQSRENIGTQITVEIV